MDYVAIDLHARYSWIRIVTAAGAPVLERRVPTTRASFEHVFAGRAPMRVLLESSTESEWVGQVIEACGHEVIVGAPGYALMYGHRDPQIKTDRRDVRALAEACRLGIYRAAHRVSREQRGRRRALRVREQLVRVRTQLINLLRAQVRHEGYRLPTGASEHVPRRYAQLPVPDGLRQTLAPIVAVLDTLGAQQIVRQSRDIGVDQVLLDRCQVGTGDRAAVETGDRAVHGERLDQHAHAARRPGTDRREADAAFAQALDGLARRLRDRLRCGHQRTVDIGNESRDLHEIGLQCRPFSGPGPGGP